MPLTLIVRAGDSAVPGDAAPRLTFDGSRIVIGRGGGCDLRLPDASVTLRHASFRAEGPGYVVVDEGSTNGTFVGGVRLPPNTPRGVRTGDLVRVGAVWLEVRIDQGPVTPDLALATRDMALALVSQAMRRLGSDVITKIHVIEGRDVGLTLALAEEGRVYTVGRGSTCDLPLLDPDVSREHASFVRRGNSVLVRDLGSKNGVVASGQRLPESREVPWPRAARLNMGKTVIVLEEPAVDALADLERSDDELLIPDRIPPAPSPVPSTRLSLHAAAHTDDAAPPPSVLTGRNVAPIAPVPGGPPSPRATAKKRAGAWSGADLAVMVAALLVLAMSIAGLIWLLRG